MSPGVTVPPHPPANGDDDVPPSPASTNAASQTSQHALGLGKDGFRERLREAAALTRLPDTVTSVLATKEDGTAPSTVARELFPKALAARRFVQRFALKRDIFEGHDEPTEEDLEVAAASGKWSKRPSTLFLKMYIDCLLTLQRDPLAGVVSPPLLGSEGTIPLSIVSVIPDIMQHYYDVIVRAEHEIHFLTNYWQSSHSVTKITDAWRELSKRAEKRQRRVVVKLVIDRGAIKQVVNPHVEVGPEGYAELDIPSKDEIPWIDLEVQNYHRLVMGTMHTKFLVVDRHVCLLNSNNIQDRPNLEMMIHLEGPIVQSFYDTALLTWNEALRPALPLLKSPPPPPLYRFQDENPYLAGIDLIKATKVARALLKKQNLDLEAERQAGTSHSLADVVQAMMKSKDVRTTLMHPTSAIEGGLAATKDPKAASGEPPPGIFRLSSTGSADHSRRSSMTDLRASRGSTTANKDLPPPTARPRVHGASSPPSDEANGEATATATATETTQRKYGHSRTSSNATATSLDDFTKRMRALSTGFNAGANKETDATLPYELFDENHQFAPHRFHRAHDPVPIATVNRKPHGMPGHMDIRNPQDAAWLAGFRYAEKHVFIQTPTLNATRVVEAIHQTCQRGVQVVLYLDIGFNDKSESFPFQGGTNQKVVKKLYADLDAEHKHFLEVYWYTGADQYRPLHAIHKRRNCHVKFMSVDSKVSILGNGNQDTQSWCHSQEVNVMVDSAQLTDDWEDMLNANQNTVRFGRTGLDGIWRDDKGRTVEELDQLELRTPEAVKVAAKAARYSA